VRPCNILYSSIVSGHPVNQVVHLINEEDVPFTFSFKEESLHTDGYASSLAVQPVSGTIDPKSRYLFMTMDNSLQNYHHLIKM